MIGFKHTIEVLNKYGQLLVEEYKSRLDSENITASSNLKNSVKYILNVNDADIELNLSLAHYWKYVDNGRKAGKWPPIDKIIEWIKVKPIIPDNRFGRLPTEKQLAYLIGRKIYEKGIEPKHTLHNSINDIMDTIFMDELEAAITQDIDEMVEVEILFLIKDI